MSDDTTPDAAPADAAEHAPAVPVAAEAVTQAEPVSETADQAGGPPDGGAGGLDASGAVEEPAKKPKKAKKSAKATDEPHAEESHAEEAQAEPAAGQDDAATESPAEGAPEAVEEPKPESKKKWYAVKVQSGREESIKSAILRKVAIEGLEDYFGEIAIPMEEVIEKKQVRVKDKKTGEYQYQEKKVTKKRKKFHGYIFAHVEFNDRILYLFRETSGVGDFLNVRGSAGNPIAEPMPEHEVKAMLTGEKVADPSRKVKVKLDFEKGDKVRIREGSFANSEGEVKAIIEAKDPNESPKVTVVLTFWGRPLDVELEATQVEKV